MMRHRESGDAFPDSLKPGPNGSDPPLPRKLRIALYSHDTMGIGHTRRNLLVAQSLSTSSPQSSILMIVGTRESSIFPMPPGTDYLTLPSLHKEADGQYCPRSLSIPLRELIAVRAHVIQVALREFKPDVLIVDKEPRGAFRELDLALKDLRVEERTLCVLGLRDVLDDAETIRREWSAVENNRAIREYYDAVWVYGDPRVYDAVREYGLPAEVASKVCYTGYLNRQTHSRTNLADTGSVLSSLAVPTERLVLCMVGGGQDGGNLAEAFAEAELPAGVTGVILAGPFMPPEVLRRLHHRAVGKPRLRVVPFVTEPDLLLHCAERVIAMGGYNTLFEVLSAGKQALIVPRVRPRLEQFIRAERLRDLGLIAMLHPDQVTPKVLTDWLRSDVQALPPVHDRIDLNGARRLPRLIGELLVSRSLPGAAPVPEEVIEHVEL